MAIFDNYVGIDVVKKDFYACFAEQSDSKKFHNITLGIRFVQKKGAEGKPYKVALVSTRHKMVKVIHSVWTNNRPFVDMAAKPKEDVSPLLVIHRIG